MASEFPSSLSSSLWRRKGGTTTQSSEYSRVDTTDNDNDDDTTDTTSRRIRPLDVETTTFGVNTASTNTDHDDDDDDDDDDDEVPLIPLVPSSNEAATTRASSYPFDCCSLQLIATIIGLLSGFLCFFTTLKADNPHINQTLGIAIWMATLWLTEIIPCVITSFLPLLLFPLFGILSSEQIATQYMNDTIWLLIAGFLVALTLQRWGLQKRFSLLILNWCGTRYPALLLLGIMGATFTLSMFVSNTAATLMMVPNAMSICTALQRQQQEEEQQQASSSTRQPQEHTDNSNKKPLQLFTQALLMGIAYSASVGGMSSLIGTGPNLVFHQQLQVLFPDAPEITFAQWLAFGLPTGLVLFGIIWLYLSINYNLLAGGMSLGLTADNNNNNNNNNNDHHHCDTTTPTTTTATTTRSNNIFEESYKALGPWTREQIIVCVLFFSVCLLWIFRSDIDFGSSLTIKGWSNLFPQPNYISDATAGMMVVFLLFVCPARSCNLDKEDKAKQEGNDDNNNDNNNNNTNNQGGEEEETAVDSDPTNNNNNNNDTTLLDWDTANQMPYSVVFLMGGGFALAKAFVSSGLSQYLGEQLASLKMNGTSLVFVFITMIVWLTELTANTSTANIMVPIAASMAVATQQSPYTYMIPATMACSCAFALPIATPPNMVVYGTNQLPAKEMNRAGIFLNLIAPFLLLGVAYTIVPAVMGVGANEFPSWGITNTTTTTASGGTAAMGE